jgi:RNA polymerase sigma-70 factor (ECF subfamily)
VSTVQETEAIWRDFNERLRGFVASRVGDTHDVDDIVQDVFLKIHSRIDQLEDESRLAPWALSIARNAVHDFYRAKARTKATSIDKVEVATAPEESDDAVELNEWMRGAIQELPEKYREAIELSEIEGLSQKELAARLGISYSGAKSRVQRGRAMIKEMLLACCHVELDRRGNIIDMKRRDDCRYCEPGCSEDC